METIIDGVSCYGKAELGANYSVVYDDEMLDFVADDIECHSWQAVVNHLKRFDPDHTPVQIEAI